MSVEIIILDPKSGALEFPSPEKSERRYGTFTIEVPASEPFENKIGKPASGYAYVRRSPYRNLQIARPNQNVETFGNVITISYELESERCPKLMFI